MYDREHFFAAIIGGGPAGSQCALWLKHLGIPSLLLEKEQKLGGQQCIAPDALSNHYVVSSTGMRASEIANAINENIKRHGVPHVCGASVDLVEDDGEWFKLTAKTSNGLHHAWSRYLVIATGVRQRDGGFIASESVFIGSADPRIRSGEFFKGKRVAVLGGGDNAFECYGFLQLQKPEKLKIFARNIRAGAKHREPVPKVAIEEGGYNVHINVNGQHCITLTDDPFGREFFDYVIVNYGVEASRILKPGIDPERNAAGFITVDSLTKSSNPRIYAIGEATQRMHPCVSTSMADGTVCAKALEAVMIKTAPDQ